MDADGKHYIFTEYIHLHIYVYEYICVVYELYIWKLDIKANQRACNIYSSNTEWKHMK